jgi:predicted HicB family RNase H-like nuclease
MNTFEYKGYIGSAEMDMESDALVGKLLFITDTITYSAQTPAALRKAFEEAVEDYLSTCAEFGDEPDKPCKGVFQVRVHPDIHRWACVQAKQGDTSLNAFVERTLIAARDSKVEHHTHVSVHLASDQQQGVVVTGGRPQTWESNLGTTTH